MNSEPLNTPPTYFSPIVTVALILGGCKATLAEFLATLKATIVVVIDNAREIEKLSARLSALGVITIAIGEGETTETLNQAFPELPPVGRGGNLPNYMGMGSDPNIGFRAGADWVKGPDYTKSLETLNDRILQCSRGRLDLVRIVEFFSGAGGQGSGNETAIRRRLPQDLASLGVPIMVESQVAGAIFVAGLAPRARTNVAGTLPAFLADLIAHDGDHPLISRTATLCESLPCGESKHLRDQVTLLEEQSLQSEEFRAHADMILPNRVGERRIGAITTRQSEVVGYLDRATHVAPTVAAELHPKVTAVIAADTFQATLFRRERWSPDHQPLPRDEIAVLAENCRSVDWPTFASSVVQPGAHYVYDFALEAFDGSLFHPADVERSFSRPPTSFREAASRMTLLATVDHLVQETSLGCQSAIKAIEAELEQATVVAERAFRRAHRGANFLSDRTLFQRLARAAQAKRSLADELREFEAKLSVVESLHPRVSRERAKLRGQLSGVEAVLRVHLPRVDRPPAAGCFTIVNDATAFAKLFVLPQSPADTHLDQVCRLVDQVLLRGMQVALGTAHADIGEIARAIAFAHPKLATPPFGAQHRQTKGVTYFCLPPMQSEVANELGDAIRKHVPNGVVVRSDTAAFGIGALRIHIHALRRFEEAFAGFYRGQVENLCSRSDRDLLAIELPKSLDRLGITFEQGRLKFPDANAEQQSRTLPPSVIAPPPPNGRRRPPSAD